MSRHLLDCDCSWCTPTENIRRLLGKIFGYPDCCIEAFENEEEGTTYQVETRRKLKKIQKKSGVECIHIFMPCYKCVEDILTACAKCCPKKKKLKNLRRRTIISVFRKFINRPFPYEYAPSSPIEDKFLKQAETILTSAEFDELYDSFVGLNLDGSGPFMGFESDSELPKYCIECD
jgi:hypothetical protein